MNRKKQCFLILIFFISIFISIFPDTDSMAGENSFRNMFIHYVRTIQFKKLEALIKKSKDVIPVEMKAMLLEAKEKERGFEEKMFLLNMANRMGLFYKDHHEGLDNLLNEINDYQNLIVKKDKAITAELMKWQKLEKIPGNFVMKKRMQEMQKQGLAPVLFPHWMHRIWFECKVCHDEIFLMKRWSNDLSDKKIRKGEQCGVCHNGEIAFPADKCIKCHMAGKPEGRHIHNLNEIDHEEIKKKSLILGAKWNPEKLDDKKLPLDRLGFINWTTLEEKGVFLPVPSLKKDFKEKIRDNKILFATNNLTVNNVLFDHKLHSSWINCSSCHPTLFKDVLGGNSIKMTDMVKGKYCGYCHGNVAFTFADCSRCHAEPKGNIPKGALLRESTNSPQ